MSGVRQEVDSVTVVTVTRGRPELLRRAMASVEAQAYSGRIEHLVLVDACDETVRALRSDRSLPSRMTWRLISRGLGDVSGAARVARLRNHAVQLLQSDWVAFLDDDNEFEPDHVRTLAECARTTGCSVVHSEMRLFYRDGTPYLEHRNPWTRDPGEGERAYWRLVDQGVFTPGSNVVHDRADPMDHPDPARTVDTGEWLFRREILLMYPFDTSYDYADWLTSTTEDIKLRDALVHARIPMASTGLPTMRYYLGGYSNDFTVPYVQGDL